MRACAGPASRFVRLGNRSSCSSDPLTPTIFMSIIRVPLTDVTLGEEEAEAAARVVRSGWVTMGAEVQAFEAEFAAAVGARHAIALTNGTAALHLAYQAAGLGSGDEFALPALTFVATLNA